MNGNYFDNKIVKKIWPKNLKRDVNGNLILSNSLIEDAVNSYGTPLLLLDSDDFTRRCKRWKKHFSSKSIYYASKAFNSSYINQQIDKFDMGLEVCSYGELLLALKNNFPASRIGLHGNNKSYSELSLAIKSGVNWIAIDAIDELAHIKEICRLNKTTQKIILRITTGAKVTTHKSIDTSVVDQKFGFSLTNGAAFDAVRQIASLNDKHINFIGLHIHIGSKIFKSDEYSEAIRRTMGFVGDIKKRLSVEVEYLNIGGGFNSPSTVHEKPFKIKKFAEMVRELVKNLSENYCVRQPKILLEPGRALISQSIVSVYRVGVIKDIELGANKIRRYVNVDGGMSDNIRPMLYGAKYSCTLARYSKKKGVLSRVVGQHCESGDILIDKVYLPEDIKTGDLIVLANTGGYARSLSSNYNLTPLPPVISIKKNGKYKEIIRRERYEDLFATDLYFKNQENITKF